MYSFDSRVRYSEVDQEGFITLASILDYFQDCSFFHSEEQKVGLKFLMEKQIAWVLSSWQVEVKRYPAYGEKIEVSTWAYDFEKFLGYRNFKIENKTGEILAFANSVWVLLDLQKGRPVRILPEMAEAYQLSPRFPMEYGSRKITLSEEMKEQEPFPVHKYHIDTNQHVNNGKYIRMAQEYLPEGFKVGKMRAEYRKAAVHGDVIYPFVAEGEKKIIVNLADEQKAPYAIVELEESE
ncbi:MAG: acyl-[acyl-carrier-protein] thioesterase [Lachnospiraceae bacterium]|nr:acyl-[acyl-carrier-protein] thioesterase [Lachnospiraceae bacterium]